MAVMIKEKGKSKAKAQVEEPTVMQLTDAAGEAVLALDKLEKSKAFRNMVKKQADLKAAADKAVDALIKKAEDKISPEEILTVKGEQFQASIGMKALVRKVSDLVKVKELLGEKVFMELALVRLGDLDKYLNPEQLNQCLSSDRSGKRRVKINPLSAD